MKTLTGFLLSLAFILQTSLALATEAQQMNIVFFEEGYPPFYMARLEEGMMIDLLNAFDEQSAEFTLVYTGLSRKRIDLAMSDGTAQASGLTNPMFVGPENVEKFLFSAPIWTSGNYIMMRKNNQFPYARPEDLFDKKLGVLFGNRNGALDAYIEEGKITAVPVRTNDLLYRNLAIGRVDAVISNKHVALYEMKKLGLDASQFVFAETPLFEFELMMQVQNPYSMFVEQMNRFIEQTKHNGVLENLLKK